MRIWDEYRSFGGTSPPPELPHLNIKRTEVSVELSWNASGSYTYYVHRSVDMRSWETVSEELAGASGERLVFTEDFDSSTPDAVFYRLEVLSGGGG